VKFSESNRRTLETLLKEHAPLLGILLGFVLLSISLGPYSSWDSQLEFAAASGVDKWGLPYTTFGNMINVPPFGYYIAVVFLKLFGFSYETGIGVMTLFGLGCVFLVSKIGEVLYGKRPGLFAAALFALTPWQLIMSRVFLVDVQCLFFSLLYLLVGIRAIQKDSNKLFFLSGILFGLALLTKLFAVFMLIPLALIYIYWGPKERKRILQGMGLFFLSALILQVLWYDVISGRGLSFIFKHDDFNMYLPSGFIPSPVFSLSFLTEILGVFFLFGFSFSLVITFLKKKLFAKIRIFDMIFLTAIIVVLGLNTYLAVGINMLNPYVNSIKYDYLTLPMFCWLAASLAKKSSIFFRRERINGRYGKLVFYIAVAGLYLLLMSMIVNLITINMISRYEWLAFHVAGGLSYSFDVLPPILESSYHWPIQVFGFVLIQFSLLWAIRDKLASFLHAAQ